jgi:hypothetical protein
MMFEALYHQIEACQWTGSIENFVNQADWCLGIINQQSAIRDGILIVNHASAFKGDWIAKIGSKFKVIPAKDMEQYFKPVDCVGGICPTPRRTPYQRGAGLDDCGMFPPV